LWVANGLSEAKNEYALARSGIVAPSISLSSIGEVTKSTIVGNMPILNGQIAHSMTKGHMITISFKPSGAGNPRREEFTILQELLDSPVRSGADIAELAVERIDIAVIDRLAALGLKADELLFIIPRRTLTHRRAQHERLSTEESDKAIRLAKIVAQATAVFADHDKAMRWLRNAQAKFGGRTALDMVSTEHGARLVEEALVQIDEGYFA
jgi:putative toxin-antitoxin system antitoxin component (TIGR02293 family)